MRSLKLIISVFILLPQLAFASNIEAFKSLVDDYSYSMSVEWDQTDKEFAATQEEAFKNGLAELVENGLTEKDIIAAFPSVKFDLFQNEFKSSSPMAFSDVSEFVKMNYKQFYNQGASWEGEAFFAVFLITAVLVGAYYLLLDECDRHHFRGENGVCIRY